MSKPKYDPSLFSTRAGNVYYDGQRVSQYRLKQYNKYIKGAVTVPHQFLNHIANISVLKHVLQQDKDILRHGQSL